MILPVGFANTRFVWACAGVTDEMGFSIATENNGVDSPQAVATDLATAFIAEFIPTAASQFVGWTFLGTRTTHNSLAGLIQADHQTAIVGTASAPGHTCNTGYLVKKLTSLGGRKNRGRLFPPPFNLAESEVAVSGHITPAAVATQIVAWGDYHDALIAADHVPVLLHSDPADAPTPITEFVPQGLAATQRRRMR